MIVALPELALGRYNQVILAGIAQLVEQLLRKQLVGGSSPLSGTIFPLNFLALLNRLPFKIGLILSQCNPGAQATVILQ